MPVERITLVGCLTKTLEPDARLAVCTSSKRLAVWAFRVTLGHEVQFITSLFRNLVFMRNSITSLSCLVFAFLCFIPCTPQAQEKPPAQNISSFEIPATDEGLPGAGPIRR